MNAGSDGTLPWESPGHGDGPGTDGFTTCGQGHEHWGTEGAAGLLIRHAGDDGMTRYLLQHRSPYVHHGGTWSTPGGARHRGESPERTALREGTEELGPLPADLDHRLTVTDDHGGWGYSTAIFDSLGQFTPDGPGPGHEWEHAGHGWFTETEIEALPQHPGFAASWDRIRREAPPVASRAGRPPVPGSRPADGARGRPALRTRARHSLRRR